MNREPLYSSALHDLCIGIGWLARITIAWESHYNRLCLLTHFRDLTTMQLSTGRRRRRKLSRTIISCSSWSVNDLFPPFFSLQYSSDNSPWPLCCGKRTDFGVSDWRRKPVGFFREKDELIYVQSVFKCVYVCMPFFLVHILHTLKCEYAFK